MNLVIYLFVLVWAKEKEICSLTGAPWRIFIPFRLEDTSIIVVVFDYSKGYIMNTQDHNKKVTCKSKHIYTTII